jgi:hypothetical protein
MIYADQRAHNVFWMTAREREALEKRLWAQPLPDTPPSSAASMVIATAPKRA